MRLVSCALLPLIAIAGPAAANPLAPIWTGIYGGVHGGARWGDVDTSSFGSISDTAADYGVHAGYSVTLGSFLVGVEGDASFDGADFDVSGALGNGSLTTDWSGTIRGRAGVLIGPALLYATAGYAWTSTSLSGTDSTGAKFGGDQDFTGVVYGIGAESYVLPNISVRLEALRYDYGAEKLSFDGAGNTLTNVDPDDTVVRAGVTFHLN
jgi:outer membrane immunogenic protein